MRPCKDWRKNTYLQFSGQGHSSDVYWLRVVAVTRIISSLKTKKMWWDEITQDEHLLIPKEKHSNSEFVFLPPSLPEQFERSCVWWWPSSQPLPPHLWLSPRSTPRPAWLWWILWWANDKSPCPENQRQEGLKINWVSTDNKNTNNCEGLSFFYLCAHYHDSDHTEGYESLPFQRMFCMAGALGESSRSHPTPLHRSSCSESKKIEWTIDIINIST